MLVTLYNSTVPQYVILEVQQETRERNRIHSTMQRIGSLSGMDNDQALHV